jgi:diacylglycerol kinase family enzyme
VTQRLHGATPVLINATAGRGCPGDFPASLEGRFRDRGIEARVMLLDSGEQLIEAANQAVRDGASMIVAGGGDGTVSAVASCLADTGVRLGVLPMGTLNHFAKDLGIPLELDEAVAVLKSGREAQVDVAEVNGQPFLNNSSLGLYPDIVRERERQQARLGRGKWPAFIWACLAALRRYSFHTVRLHVEGRELVRRTPFVFVGNNDYDLSGRDIGERHRLDEGELCVWVAHRPGRLGLLWFALAALFGQLHRVHGFDRLKTPRLLIETHASRLRVSTDGEVQELDAPLDYRCRPRALRVRVPAA